MKDPSLNAGPRAENGFALQRNSALYLLMENYHSKFRGEKFFICLEHHDDFLFVFLDDHEEVAYIEAYQSKKKSPDKWTINQEMSTIIGKLLSTGVNLIKDPIPKSEDYTHCLFFSSNSSIRLKEGATNISIDEERLSIAYKSLGDKLQDKIRLKLKEDLNGVFTAELEAELQNLHFHYIVLPRTDKEQQNQLIGKIEEVFKDSVSNPRAALITILHLFRNIETIYNQGNTARLLDESKRVHSEDISEVFSLITTKSKAFNFWRDESKSISRILNIKPFERDQFKMSFESAFDLFKSLEQVQHQRVLKFVKENYLKCITTQEEENVLELFDMIRSETSVPFDDLNLKATIYAAYFEAIHKQKNNEQ